MSSWTGRILLPLLRRRLPHSQVPMARTKTGTYEPPDPWVLTELEIVFDSDTAPTVPLVALAL